MVMDVMTAAARIEEAGGKVIHMEVGQPAAPAPRTAIAAAKAALDVGRISYTEALGIPPLVHALPVTILNIRRHGRSRPHRCDDRIFRRIHSGVSRAFEPGDRVAVAEPGYPPYRHILTALG